MMNTIEDNLYNCFMYNYQVMKRPMHSKFDQALINKDTRDELEIVEGNLLNLLSGPPVVNQSHYAELLLKNTSFDFDDIAEKMIDVKRKYLSLMTMCMMSKMDSVVEDDLEVAKVIEGIFQIGEGMYHMYTQPQRKTQSGNYIGSGIIFAIIDGKPIRLFVMDDVLTKIEVESAASIKSMLPRLSRFMIRMRLKVDKNTRKKKPVCVSEKDGAFRIKTDSVGTEIIVVGTIPVPRIKKVSYEFYVNKVGGLAMRLSLNDFVGESLSFYPRLSVEKSSRIDNDLVNKWMSDSTLTNDDLREYFTILRDSSYDDSLEGRKKHSILKEWTASTLLARMRHLGILKDVVPQFDRKDIDEDSSMSSGMSDARITFRDLDVRQYDIEYPEMNVDMMELALREEAYSKIIVTNVEDVEGLIDDPVRITIARNVLFRYRTFWDSFIENEINDIIQGRTIAEDLGPTVKEIIEMCGIQTGRRRPRVSDFLNF
jgi:hypothetical protein